MQNSVSIVDIYQKTDDQKNLTYRLEMRHKEHTLTTEEASDITSKVVEQVVQKHGAKQV
jgi:phenylalanyl-tRNA synthetase beta subunit